jgi:hypothetical protein
MFRELLKAQAGCKEGRPNDGCSPTQIEQGNSSALIGPAFSAPARPPPQRRRSAAQATPRCSLIPTRGVARQQYDRGRQPQDDESAEDCGVALWEHRRPHRSEAAANGRNGPAPPSPRAPPAEEGPDCGHRFVQAPRRHLSVEGHRSGVMPFPPRRFWAKGSPPRPKARGVRGRRSRRLFLCLPSTT